MRTKRSTPTAAALKPAAPPKRKGPVGSGIPGRWMRVVRTPKGAPHPVDREVADASEAAAVRAGWLLVDAYERLSIAGAEKVFGHELDAWHAYADDTIVPLEHPKGFESMEMQEGKANLLRYRRTMDFARRGDRVFDVGFGRGYLAAQLIKERGVEHYQGIDVEMAYRLQAEALFEANAVAGEAITLEEGDLFELTPEKVAATEASLVICCEVLEHVDDAELALRTLARALPEGADLVFSVPLHGRLESVWGHVSVFDVARLKEMLDGAGLHAHHVEPLANTWCLVVASSSPAPSTRVSEADRRPPIRASVALSEHRVFVDVGSEEVAAFDGGEITVPAVKDPANDIVVCRTASGGGVTFPVAGLEAMRIQLDVTNADAVQQFVVRAYAGKTRACTWVWRRTGRQAAARVRRFSLRPGERSGLFVSNGHRDLERADRVVVVAKMEPGATAEFTVKAAYLP